jgi:protein-S-isoprenylcysteine O-methyltransferase Ste14
MSIYRLFLCIFIISELLLLVSRKSRKTDTKRRSDGRSLLLLWLIISACMTSGYLLADRHIWPMGNPSLIKAIGIIVVIAGFLFRWIAIFQLGNMFTVDVSISINHVLKTDGLYKIVRHPTYWGLILIIAGLAILTNSALSALVIILPIYCILNYRITVEERALINEFGDQYLRYKLRVKKIVPFLY